MIKIFQINLVRSLAIVFLFCIFATNAGAEIKRPRVLPDQDYQAICSFTLDSIVSGTGVRNADPDLVRSNWRQNARCLFGFLERANAAPPIGERALSELIVVTGTLRAIIEYAASVELRSSVDFLRQNNSIDAVFTLAYLARSQNYSLRYNSSFILANIVDNNTVCVIVDHIYDRTYLEDEVGRNGRANLLGVLRAVAAWVGPLNRGRILKMVDTIGIAIAQEKDVETTRRLLDELMIRLVREPSESGRGGNCAFYTPKFAPGDWNG